MPEPQTQVFRVLASLGEFRRMFSVATHTPALAIGNVAHAHPAYKPQTVIQVHRVIGHCHVCKTPLLDTDRPPIIGDRVVCHTAACIWQANRLMRATKQLPYQRKGRS